MVLKMLKRNGRKIACILLLAAMCLSAALSQLPSLSLGVGSISALASSEGAGKDVLFTNVTGSVDLSDIKLSNLSSAVMLNDKATYEDRAVVISLGGATLSEKANGIDIGEYINTEAGKNQRALIENEQKKLLRNLAKEGIDYTLLTSYDTVMNAVAVRINTSNVSKIKQMANVESVFISQTYAAPKTVEQSTASSISNDTKVYKTGIYDSSAYAEQYGGKGMAVAVLDTGLDYTHEAFQTQPDPATVKYVEAPNGDDSKIAISEKMASGKLSAKGDVYVSSKIPFAYDYADKDADVYPSYSNHGTHVAGIIAGSADSYTDKEGNVAVDENGKEIPFVSVAPHSQLVICKVFTDDLDAKTVGGAESYDIIAALDDCVELGVDVINMSLGTTCGFTTTDDGDDEGYELNRVYESIKSAGISLICAASNDYSSAYGGVFGTNLVSNPDSGTVGSPSTFASALSVASISGKKSPYLLADKGVGESDIPVFYQESSDENNVDYNFAEAMLGGEKSKKFKYVVIGGVGQTQDYQSGAVKRAISDAKANGEKIIALVKRGNNTFQDKVEIAKEAGADAIIIYNNVAGEIKMTIGDVEDPIPAISITFEAGEKMRTAVDKSKVGYITIDTSYEAGPFMSNFSSWGVTSDLKLKPEITAHGGEITSSVPGGWNEQSGTSMATPNIAGLTANVRSYIAQKYPDLTPKQVTQLTNQLMMSTATIVKDQKGLPYSPRKQGAGLASLENIIETNAYLYTVENEIINSAHGDYYGAIDNRPKLELGDDKSKVGKYTLSFYVRNDGATALKFKLNTLFMTESSTREDDEDPSDDKAYSVKEQAHLLDGDAVWTYGGASYKNGDEITVNGNSYAPISVILTLSKDEKEYLETNFVNGMFVEGFIQLESADKQSQCSLSLPFMGFYGDWEAAPMLDYDAFEISAIKQDTSLTDEEKPQASVWATQAYSVYWNDKFVLPMGSFVYTQNEDDDEVRKIYTTEEYSSISCYNDYQGDDENNYMTSTGIKGIYAGLLRNAKQVNCRMYDAYTGELLYDKVVYRVNKAYTGGGSTTPGFVKLELTPEELGLKENGKYKMEFDFHYQKPENEDDPVPEENTFEFSFYVDYSAPVLEDARIRYDDVKDESGKITGQRAYLEMDVYDNHYSMAALLCYMDNTDPDNPQLQLVTDYVTPIYDPQKNGTTIVSIEVTDILEKYGNNFYVELDDYALNHSVYKIDISDAKDGQLPSTFDLKKGEEEITLGIYETHRVELEWDKKLYPQTNLANFTWSVSGNSTDIVAVKNGEIVGLKEGTGTVIVSKGSQQKQIKVTVKDDGTAEYITPSISFGVILNAVKAPVKATGLVEVNISQKIKLEVETDPWFYPLISDYELEWQSLTPSVATVDQEGNVTLYKKGRSIIQAKMKETGAVALVTLDVQEPFKVSNYALTGYEGAGGVVYIPTDMNIMSIGEGAFKNNEDITAVIIPKTVTSIDVRAFYNCKNLKYVFFVDVTTQDIAEADLTLINREAFYGCTSLEYLDFSNCKTFTVARNAFYGCDSLKLIKGIEHIGTAYDSAFEGCTSLVGSLAGRSGVDLVDRDSIVKDAEENNKITAFNAIAFENLTVDVLDISGLHVSGSYVFKDCVSIKDIKTGVFTALGRYMFYGCSSLKDVTITETVTVSDYAFANSKIRSLTFDGVKNGKIGNYAFAYCGNLFEINYVNSTIYSIGDYAFIQTYLDSFVLPNGIKAVGNEILSGSDVQQVEITEGILASLSFTGASFKGIPVKVVDTGSVIEGDVVYNANKTKLLLVQSTAQSVQIASSVTEIGAYAFAGSSVKSIVIPASVERIGAGAFENSKLAQIIFEDGSKLKYVDDSAFRGSDIISIIVPSGVISIGDYAFAKTPISQFNMTAAVGVEASFGSYVFSECDNLVEIDLSASNVTKIGEGTFANASSLSKVTFASIKELGDFTFSGATSLTEVVFGEDSETTGNFTFVTEVPNWTTMTMDLVSYDKLTSVTIGENVKTIGEYAFVACTALTSFDLKNASSVGNYAFYECLSLNVIKGIENLESIGNYAFKNCKAMEALDISAAKYIGEGAFAIERYVGEESLVAYKTVALDSAEYIGAFAFYGNSFTSVELPASINDKKQTTVQNIDGVDYGTAYLSVIGEGAFAASTALTEFKVAKGNPTYFTVINDDEAKTNDGVLYRKTESGEFELISYPAKKVTGTAEYFIEENTVRIMPYAFAGADKITKVTLPHSLKTVGSGAFYSTAIQEYSFKSYSAPALESDYDASLINLNMAYISFRGLFNNNFNTYLISHAAEVSEESVISTLKMNYPENGIGYDGYMYRKYFPTSKRAEQVLNDYAAEAKSNLENLEYTLAQVRGWLESGNEPSKETVISFSAKLTEIHRLYNNVINDSVQCELIGEENIKLLNDMEEALRAVKTKLNIPLSVKEYKAKEGSYKKSYVEGELFDPTGLTVVFTYDDYSTEEFTGAEVAIPDRYITTPLSELDRIIYVECKGISVPVVINIKAETDEEVPPTDLPGDSGSSSGSQISSDEGENALTGKILGIVFGSVGGAAAVGAGAFFLVKYLKKRKK